VILAGGSLVHDFTNFNMYGGKTITLSADSSIGVTSGHQINFQGTMNGGGRSLTIIGGGTFYLGEDASSISNVTSIHVAGGSALGSDTNAAGWGGTAGVPGSGPTITIDNGCTAQIFNNVTMPNPLVLNGTPGDNGALWKEGGAAGGGYSGPITLNGFATIIGGNADFTLSGNISGPAALIKNGASTITLSGDNPYSGGTHTK